jgi:glycerol-3-phosphate dehydrogenase
MTSIEKINYIEELPDSVDIAIVGGGIIGVFIAYELSRYNIKVIVIEKNSELGFGVSRGQTGIIHVIQTPFKSLKSRLCIEGNKRYREYVKKLEVGYKEYDLYMVALGYLESLILPFIWLILRRNGYQCNMLRGATLRKKDPSLSDKVKLAIRVKGYGAVDSLNMIYALAEAASRNGVLFAVETEVTNISINNNAKWVHTNRGIVKTNIVIDAAGLYSDKIASYMGRKNINILPAKGANIVFDDPFHQKNFYVGLPIHRDPRTKGGGALLTWDGRIIWGPDFKVISDKEDTTIEKDNYRNLINKFSKIFKRMPNNPIRIYSGVRPINKDGGDFIIEDHMQNGLIILAGIDSPGFTSAPIIAQKVIDMVRRYLGKLTLKKRFIDSRRDINRVSRLSLDEIDKLITIDPDYGRIIGRDPPVSLGMVKEAIERGARTLYGIMYRTGLYMGREADMPMLDKILDIYSRASGGDIDSLTLEGNNSYLLYKVDR